MKVEKMFSILDGCPANHPIWKNDWQFTRPVFMNESRQGTMLAEFKKYTRIMPEGLYPYLVQKCEAINAEHKKLARKLTL